MRVGGVRAAGDVERLRHQAEDGDATVEDVGHEAVIRDGSQPGGRTRRRQAHDRRRPLRPAPVQRVSEDDGRQVEELRDRQPCPVHRVDDDDVGRLVAERLQQLVHGRTAVEDVVDPLPDRLEVDIRRQLPSERYGASRRPCASTRWRIDSGALTRTACPRAASRSASASAGGTFPPPSQVTIRTRPRCIGSLRDATCVGAFAAPVGAGSWIVCSARHAGCARRHTPTVIRVTRAVGASGRRTSASPPRSRRGRDRLGQTLDIVACRLGGRPQAGQRG